MDRRIVPGACLLDLGSVVWGYSWSGWLRMTNDFEQFDFVSGDFEDDDDEEFYVPCCVCSCLIGDEVAYGDTWDGRWVCDNCAGVAQ